MSARAPVLVVGVDGATFDLMLPWVEAGLLPTIGRLLDEGVRARTRCPLPVTASTAWASAATGCNPGRHGVVGPRRAHRGNATSRPAAPGEVRPPRVWDIAAQCGRRTLLLGAPLTSPARPSRLPARGTGALAVADDAGLATLRADALEAQRRDTEAAAAMLAREAWDLAWISFPHLDVVQRRGWSFMDPSHPAHPGPGRWEHVVRDLYVSLDGALGRLLAGRGNETTVVLASAHGTAPLYRRLCLSAWLEDAGFLRRSQDATGRHGLRRLLPWGRRERAADGASLGADAPVDWSGTRVHAPEGTSGALWVNLAGREPHGVVRPGAEYEAVVAELRRRMLALRDPATGERLVAAVHRREEIYQGPYTAEAPDLLVETVRTVCPVGSGQPSVLSDAGTAGDDTGMRAREGLLVLHGPDIRAGLELCSVPVDDLAPTVLYLLAVPIAPDMDGRVLAEALDAERLARQPIAVSERPYAPPAAESPRGRQTAAGRQGRVEGRVPA